MKQQQITEHFEILSNFFQHSPYGGKSLVQCLLEFYPSCTLTFDAHCTLNRKKVFKRFGLNKLTNAIFIIGFVLFTQT